LTPSGGDVSGCRPVGHSILARAVGDRQRTAVFARYSLVGALVGALGALFAGLPDLFAVAIHGSAKTAYQAMFLLYGLLGVASGLIYRKLPPTLAAGYEAPAAPLRQ